MAEENNIGASRLLGTNGLQQAVDSLTTQVNKMSGDIGRLVSSMDSMTGSMNKGGGYSGGNWNTNSNNRRYGANGGNAMFSGLGVRQSRGGIGGGVTFGNLARGSRLSAGIGTALAVGGALVNYANRNMDTNMIMDYAATQSMANGGWGAGGQSAARQLANGLFFQNRYGALGAQDAAQAAAIAQYTYGNAQFGGQVNPVFARGFNQIGSFAYANPTLGMTGAAQAAQQTFSQRSIIMGRVLGLNINPNGNMTNIAQQIYARTFGGQTPTQKQFAAAVQQGGSLNVNLAYLGQQLGWSAQTQQEFQGVLQGQVNAKANGMSASQYYSLLNQAQSGNNKAAMQLSRATGLNTSMFEKQRNLTDTQLTRQSDILNSLAPAFNKATDAVNQFSKALTAMMKDTGLDQLVGAGAGGLSPLSNAAGGFMNTLGMGGGLFAASKLFGGSGGLLGMFKNLGMKIGSTPATANLGARLGGSLGTDAALGEAGAAGTSSVLGAVALPAGMALGFKAGADYLNNKELQKQYGVPIPSDYTQADFDNYIRIRQKDSSLMRGAWRMSAANWIRAYFAMNPAGTKKPRDPGYTAMDMAKLSPGTGRSGGASNPSGSVGGSPGNGSSNIGANAATIINWAKKELGVPYGWGQESPGKAFDCSGLIQWAYGQAGVSIPRVAIDQRDSAPMKVPVNNTQPGDLLFVGQDAHHVVMDIGGGQIIEAPHTGADVRIRALNPSEYTDARRYVNAIGNMSSLLNNNSAGNQNTLNNAQSLVGGDIGDYTSEASALAAALSNFGGGPSVSASGGSTTTSSNGSTSSGTPAGNGKNDIASLQSYAKQLLAARGWSSQWDSLNNIINHESGWSVTATNPSSGAYGIPQSLPGNKMASAGSDWKTNGDTQLQWMMSYIKDRYGDPNQAWSYWQAHSSYAVGAWKIDKDQPATVHAGEMIIPAQQAETIRQTLMNNQFNPGLSRGAGINQGGGKIDINVNVVLPSNYSGSAADSKAAGAMIADAIANDTRIKQLQEGQ